MVADHPKLEKLALYLSDFFSHSLLTKKKNAFPSRKKETFCFKRTTKPTYRTKQTNKQKKMLRAASSIAPVAQQNLLQPWIFWVVAFIIGFLIIFIIQCINTWLITGRIRNCTRHVRCNQWQQCSSTWYLFNFAFFFVLALLSGYAWWAGLLFIIIFKLIEYLLAFCCCWYFQGKCGNCGVEFLLAFLGYLLGLIFRYTLCWFPASGCWALHSGCSTPCTAGRW